MLREQFGQVVPCPVQSGFDGTLGQSGQLLNLCVGQQFNITEDQDLPEIVRKLFDGPMHRLFEFFAGHYRFGIVRPLSNWPVVPPLDAVIDPSGEANVDYSDVALVENGRLDYPISWAGDDSEGEWNVRVTDLSPSPPLCSLVSSVVKLPLRTSLVRRNHPCNTDDSAEPD